MDPHYDCIIIGAGIAGASVAWHLSRARGGGGILVVEREDAPGAHASAQNAGMIRSLVLEEPTAELALQGVGFWRDPPEGLRVPGIFRETGGLLLASEPRTLEALEARAAQARERGYRSERWTADQCKSAYPILERTPITGAVVAHQDGIADPAAMIDAFLREAARGGVEIALGRPVPRIDIEGQKAAGIRLEDRRLRAETVVVAAGAWSQLLIGAAGLDDQGLRPYRRHLFCTAPTSLADQQMPFVWHADLGAYFREEAGGLLFSVCDEDEVPPGRPPVDPGIAALAERKLAGVFPFLNELPIARCWAGLRTFTEDRRFLLGKDPNVSGLFYATGLGGHGVTCAGPVGRIVAESVTRYLRTNARS